MPYDIYEYDPNPPRIEENKATIKRSSFDVIAIPLATGEVWVARRDGKGRGALLDNATFQKQNRDGQFKAKKTGTQQALQIGDGDLRGIADQKKQAEDTADSKALTDHKQPFVPMSYSDVVARLETAFLQAKSAQQPDLTRINTALEKLRNFIKRTEGSYISASFIYSLEHTFVGETAHIRAARIMNPIDLIMDIRSGAKNEKKALSIKYKLEGPNPSKRFLKFVERKVDDAQQQQVTAAKTNINEELIAPRTIRYRLDPKITHPASRAHGDVLEGFLDDLSAARRQELAEWVRQKMKESDLPQSKLPRRAGIWIRNVVPQPGDTHSADQNMSQERFEKILQAVQAAGIQEIILLGDGLEPKRQRMPKSAPKVVHDFSRLWDLNKPPIGSYGQVELQGGYAEQVAVYTALYRERGMECIIGNKSGGLDLPSLAGVPQIQIAEMDAKELMVHHRMGFQAMCSPFWTVVRANNRQSNEKMDLTDAQREYLTECIRRAQRVRTWHILAVGAHQWSYWKRSAQINAQKDLKELGIQTKLETADIEVKAEVNAYKIGGSELTSVENNGGGDCLFLSIGQLVQREYNVQQAHDAIRARTVKHLADVIATQPAPTFCPGPARMLNMAQYSSDHPPMDQATFIESLEAALEFHRAAWPEDYYASLAAYQAGMAKPGIYGDFISLALISHLYEKRIHVLVMQPGASYVLLVLNTSAPQGQDWHLVNYSNAHFEALRPNG